MIFPITVGNSLPGPSTKACPKHDFRHLGVGQHYPVSFRHFCIRYTIVAVGVQLEEFHSCLWVLETHGSLIFIRVLRIYNVLYFLLLEDLSIFLIVFSGLLSAKWAVVHNTIEPALKVLCSSKLNFQFLEMNFQNERTVSPVFQERGLFRTDYEGTTLREHLGLKPAVSRYARASGQPTAE